MFIYLLIFVIALLYLWLDSSFKKSSNLYLFLFFMYLAVFIGLGDMIGGYDRYVYGEVFDTISDTIQQGRGLQDTYDLINGTEFGYFFWQVLVGNVTRNRYIFILITSIFIYLLYFRAFKLYMDRYPLACIVFLGLLFYFTMTYLRQVIAVGLVWQSVQYVWERKFFKFIFFILLAFSFHNSALIFLPMYFIPNRKYSRTAIIIFLVACLLVSISPIPNMLLQSTGDLTGMSQRTMSYTHEYQGFRIEYLLETIFFLFILLRNYNKLQFTPKETVFFNMSIIFCGILLLFMQFGQGGRLGWYYMIGLIYMLSHLSYIPNAFRWMKPLVISVSFLLFLRITVSWERLNIPYKTFLTNGEPAGNGYIYDHFEYDYRYTKDKFYR